MADVDFAQALRGLADTLAALIKRKAYQPLLRGGLGAFGFNRSRTRSMARSTADCSGRGGPSSPPRGGLVRFGARGFGIGQG